VHVRLKQTQILRWKQRYVVTTLRCDIFFCVRFLQLFSIVSATVGPTVHVRLKQTQIYVGNKDML
jgi:hypothetical protein